MTAPQISPDTVDALRAKLGTFSKDELIGELIGALIELASPRGSAIKPIGCMRPVCPHTEKCAEAWKCLNPIHSDRSDHGVVRPIDDSVPRSGSNGGLGHHQQMKSTQAMRDRIRELMQREQDDYDRAVECVLDDLEGMLGSAQTSGWQPIETRPIDPQATYLVANEKGQVAPCIRGVIHNNVGSAWDWSYGEAIVRWMPLPTYSDSSTDRLPVVTSGLEPDQNSASGYRVTSNVREGK